MTYLVLVEEEPGRSRRYAIRVAGERLSVGSISLRAGTPDDVRVAGNVGFTVQPAHQGHGYAAQALRLLATMVKEPLWITCDPENRASRRTCERAGAVYVDMVDVPPEHEQRRLLGSPRKCRYRLDLPTFGPTSPPA